MRTRLLPPRAMPQFIDEPSCLERVVWANEHIRVGAFRCPVDAPDFTTAGAIEGYTIFFPRSAVWIERTDRPAFVADPRVVTIYNRGEPYFRRPLAPDGDRGEWFSVSRELAVSIMAAIDPEAAADPAGPFPVALGRSDPSIYYRQRLLFTSLERGDLVDPFEVEQEVTLLIGDVLEQAVHRRSPAKRRERSRDRHELVERARAELARDPFASPTVRELAATVGASPFHLCRVFRLATGLTLHHYLLELRTRLALERFETGPQSLSRLAHELGFSSHSHFTATVRRRLGMAPSRIRRQLRVGRPATH